MKVRRHIAALALFGVQLLQGILPAAGGLCERSVSTVAQGVATTAIPVLHHHGHDAGQPSSEHAPRQAPSDCPTAMACSVVGVVSSAVVVTTTDMVVEVHRSRHVENWPLSLDFAPEPPPPRG